MLSQLLPTFAIEVKIMLRGFGYQISPEPFSHVQKTVHISVVVGLLSAFFSASLGANIVLSLVYYHD